MTNPDEYPEPDRDQVADVVDPTVTRVRRVPTIPDTTANSDAIEIFQRHHRYAVVALSPHPETGGVYTWYDSNNQPVRDVAPKPPELPHLPEKWVVRR